MKLKLCKSLVFVLALGSLASCGLDLSSSSALLSSVPDSSVDSSIFSSLEAAGLTFVQSKREAAKVNALSADSVTLYKAFYQNTAPLALSGEDQTKSYSVFDAFVNFAMLTYFSEGEAQEKLLPLFAVDDPSGLPKAVRELTWALGTPINRSFLGSAENVPHGGYSANSVWYDAGLLTPRGDKEGEAAFEDLRDSFYASLFPSRPTGAKIHRWLEQTLPEGYDIPSIPGSADSDAALVSSYFLKIPNLYRERAKQVYEEGKNRLDYTFDEKTIRSGYTSYHNMYGGAYFESDNLLGGTNSDYGLSVFLPKDESALPSSIRGEVIGETYETKRTHGHYDVTIPYFAIDKQELTLNKLFAPKIGDALGHRVCQKLFAEDLFVDAIKQYSKLSFDYDGFYSASVTVTWMATSAAPVQDVPFELIVNRPFFFREAITVGGESLPVVVGEIIDPGYEK